MNASEDGPTFAAPWEAKAFALAIALRDAGHLSWPTFASARASREAAQPDEPYYERWLAALEDLTGPDAHRHEH